MFRRHLLQPLMHHPKVFTMAAVFVEGMSMIFIAVTICLHPTLRDVG